MFAFPRCTVLPFRRGPDRALRRRPAAAALCCKGRGVSEPRRSGRADGFLVGGEDTESAMRFKKKNMFLFSEYEMFLK